MDFKTNRTYSEALAKLDELRNNLEDMSTVNRNLLKKKKKELEPILIKFLREKSFSFNNIIKRKLSNILKIICIKLGQYERSSYYNLLLKKLDDNI